MSIEAVLQHAYERGRLAAERGEERLHPHWDLNKGQPAMQQILAKQWLKGYDSSATARAAEILREYGVKG